MSANPKDFKNIIDFIQADPNGPNLIDRLKRLESQNKQYSDLQDKEGNYYINLVQEGGGTLGIALVGFTFVLEYCKIRFLKLAGTSAGAINTILLHHLDSPEKAKTPRLFEVIKSQDLKQFVDGNKITKFIISNILNKTGRVDALGIFFISLLLLLLTVIPILAMISNSTGTIYLVVVSLFLLFIFLILRYYSSIKKNKFGLNKGDEFLKFMRNNIPPENINKEEVMANFFKDEALMQEHNIEAFRVSHDQVNREKIAEIQEKANEQKKRLFRPTHEYKRGYTVIASETVSQNKVEFPRDADLFWTGEGLDQPDPSEFARASMSIPIFFKPYIKPIKTSHPNIVKAWKEKMNYGNGNENEIPTEAWFTDGGTLSNFPINIFHNSNVVFARVPVIGVRLQDQKAQKNTSFSSLFSYLYAIFNTARFNYDKSFLRKHSFYQTFCVSNIEVYKSKISWLNFSLGDDEKRKLIIHGVEAALTHLENFDWKKYQIARAEMVVNNND